MAPLLPNRNKEEREGRPGKFAQERIELKEEEEATFKSIRSPTAVRSLFPEEGEKEEGGKVGTNRQTQKG